MLRARAADARRGRNGGQAATIGYFFFLFMRRALLITSVSLAKSSSLSNDLAEGSALSADPLQPIVIRGCKRAHGPKLNKSGFSSH